MNSFFYNIGQGLKNIWRNKMFSLASIATMSATIFLLGIFYSVGVNFGGMVEEIEDGVAITVFFEEGVSDETVMAVGEAIGARPEVANYHFVSADEAMQEYINDVFGGDEELAAEMTETFGDDNPLADSFNYEIYLNDVSQQDELVAYLEGLEGVRKVRRSAEAANTLSDFNVLIKYVSVGVIAILIAIAVFLISNTVTVGINVRSEEIAIMKLIGAKDSFVRAPFIVEGIVIGLIGSLIPLAILYFMYTGIMDYVSNSFDALQNLLDFVPVTEIFRIILPASLILGVGIGYVGSRFTLHRHLKV